MEKVAIVTPYYKEDISVLSKCHKSVLEQTLECDHFLISDGHPMREVDNWRAKHVVLPNSHGDNGNTPRGLGSILAESEGYDYVAYLDADNWYHKNHVESLLVLNNKKNYDVCCSFRSIHTLAGDEMIGVIDADELTLAHVDTSAFMIYKTAFRSFDIWLKMPRILSPVCDRIFFAGLKDANYKIGFSKNKSVAFRSQYKGHYMMANLPVPDGSKADVGSEARKWLLSIAGVREVTKRLGFYPI